MNLLNRFGLLSMIGSKYPVLTSIQNKSPILSIQRVNFVGRHHYSSESNNNNSNEWIQSLDEETKQRIQYIQNEVNVAIKLNEGHEKKNNSYICKLVNTTCASTTQSSETGVGIKG